MAHEMDGFVIRVELRSGVAVGSATDRSSNTDHASDPTLGLEPRLKRRLGAAEGMAEGAARAEGTLRDGELLMRVVLEATPRGEASAAFWRFAEQLRNDVVRDTRKWRRLGLGGGEAVAARLRKGQPGKAKGQMGKHHEAHNSDATSLGK
uniref:Uncharacterized protein n=1 Tax=Haptolina brevifila TaxID=156173 RepID=A0A7S2BJW4_9EUKA|mmetsp:Transcript_13526/g.27205  ORF Transcript_13526/g.27205 Transcript_13526/m.27205 type:complete len:150 (+) Transcript_13526:3-452(+)